MAVEYHYNSEQGYLMISIVGEPRFEELQQAGMEITASNEFPSDVSALYDLTRMDFSNVTLEFEQKVIALRKQLERGDAKIAIVTPGGGEFGLGRMYETLSENLPQTTKVFKLMHEAEQWLIS